MTHKFCFLRGSTGEELPRPPLVATPLEVLFNYPHNKRIPLYLEQRSDNPPDAWALETLWLSGEHWPVRIYSMWATPTPVPDDQRMQSAGRGSWGEPEATFRTGPDAHQSAQSTRSQVPARSVHVRGSSQRSTRHSVDSVRRQPSRRLRATSCSKSARKATRNVFLRI